MKELFDKFINLIKNFNFGGGLVVFGWALIMFWMIRLAQKNRASVLNALMVLVFIASAALVYFSELPNQTFYAVPLAFVLLYIILFSTEIKRGIWSMGKEKGVKGNLGLVVEDEDRCIESIVKSLLNMSKNRVGALIVLANDNFPQSILDSGTMVNAEISSALIESIFFPNTPLHDGAMVVLGTKILAVSCFLPLTQNDSVPRDLGTRHRAGIGITETINVTAIIVSEETGVISIAKEGKLTRFATAEILRAELSKFYWQKGE